MHSRKEPNGSDAPDSRDGWFGRRTLLAGAGALSMGSLALGSLATARPASAAPAGDRTHHDGRYRRRAVAAYDALRKFFRDPDTGYYLEEYPRVSENPWCYVWPYSQAMIAGQCMAGIPGIGPRYRRYVERDYRVLEDYWNAETDPPGYDSYLRPPHGQGGDKFYDDNEWIALGLLQRHQMHGGRLERAAEIFDLVVFGWDDDPSHPCPGGVFWTQADWSRDRNTISNGPGAQVGLHLAMATGQRSRLDWALRMYEWTRGCLLAPNELYWDHIDLEGNIEKTQWSYNQGVMIGAGELLYRATGKKRYLQQARRTAEAALAYYADGKYWEQPARFHAIFFANLLRLWTITHDERYRTAMRDYADEAYERFVDRSTGLYRFEGDEPVTLLEQAGMVRIQAMSAWSPRDYTKLT